MLVQGQAYAYWVPHRFVAVGCSTFTWLVVIAGVALGLVTFLAFVYEVATPHVEDTDEQNAFLNFILDLEAHQVRQPSPSSMPQFPPTQYCFICESR